MEIHCNFQEQFKSQYKEEFSNCFSKQKFLYIYISVRTAQELSLNSSSKTVLEKVLKENGPFRVQKLFLDTSKDISCPVLELSSSILEPILLSFRTIFRNTHS